MKYDVTLQTIAWLNGRRNDHTLEISPKFQRRPVWLEKERSELIGTICSALPFPEIYVHHDTNPEDGSERHIVVDGQQRVTTIMMFIDGEVTLPDEEWGGRAFKEFSVEEKATFWNYKVVVRSLSQTNDAEIRDLFARLNTNNIALNDQEVRNARYKGRFKQMAERVADNPLFQALGLFTARDVRRMLDVEFASELLVLTVEGITNKKDLLDVTYASYEEEFAREAEIEEEANAALGLVRTLITDQNKAQAKKKSNFYTLYGACLRYNREYNRTAFRKPDLIAKELTSLLSATKLEDVEGRPDYYRRYFEAVSRAASDKSRRAERESIVSHVIGSVEVGNAPEQLSLPVPLPLEAPAAEETTESD